jgi:hypothetical protein
MGIVLWKKREVAKEFAAARGGSGVVLYGTNGGTERAGRLFFCRPLICSVGWNDEISEGQGGKTEKHPTLGLF